MSDPTAMTSLQSRIAKFQELAAGSGRAPAEPAAVSAELNANAKALNQELESLVRAEQAVAESKSSEVRSKLAAVRQANAARKEALQQAGRERIAASDRLEQELKSQRERQVAASQKQVAQATALLKACEERQKQAKPLPVPATTSTRTSHPPAMNWSDFLNASGSVAPSSKESAASPPAEPPGRSEDSDKPSRGPGWSTYLEE